MYWKSWSSSSNQRPIWTKAKLATLSKICCVGSTLDHHAHWISFLLSRIWQRILSYFQFLGDVSLKKLISPGVATTTHAHLRFLKLSICNSRFKSFKCWLLYSSKQRFSAGRLRVNKGFQIFSFFFRFAMDKTVFYMNERYLRLKL